MMSLNDHKGVFITIEGPNGIGKTSVTNGVAMQIRENGFSVLQTSEPTNSKLGILARKTESVLSNLSYACLIAADRYYHLDKIILPSLFKNQVVISARYVESSMVLQRLDGLELDYVWNLNSELLKPDISIILMADAKNLDKRLQDRSKLSKFENLFTREMEIKYYLDSYAYLKKKGFNIIIVENQVTSIEENVSDIVKLILNVLKN